MKTAKNMKELEKMIMDDLKKKFPQWSKEYLRKWYSENPEIKDIIPEEDFAELVRKSTSVKTSNGKLEMEAKLALDDSMPDETKKLLSDYWDIFKDGYMDYLNKKMK